MAHVLYEQDRRGTLSQDHIADDTLAVGVLVGEDVIPTGMDDAASAEVVGVERFIDHGGVRPLAERVHHGGRDVAGARPQGDAGDGHPPTERAMAARYRSPSRLVIGPSDASPMRRPSTERTGVRPPKVPVTKASSAE